jgi:hypothetical protein
MGPNGGSVAMDSDVSDLNSSLCPFTCISNEQEESSLLTNSSQLSVLRYIEENEIEKDTRFSLTRSMRWKLGRGGCQLWKCDRVQYV